MIEVTSDNLNRTVAEIRHIFTKHGGHLGEPNSVAWIFEKRGHIEIDSTKYSEDAAMEAALEAGAEDVESEDGRHVIITKPEQLHGVREALVDTGLEVIDAEVAMIPRTTVKVEGKDAVQLIKLMDLLDEHDDVSKVSSNFDIDADTLAEVGR